MTLEKVYAVKYLNHSYLRVNEHDYFEKTTSKAKATTYERFEDAQGMVDVINGLRDEMKCRLSIWEVTETSDPIDAIDPEWLKLFIAEERTVYGEYPSEQRVLSSWEQNKEYFYQHKGMPAFFIETSKVNEKGRNNRQECVNND
jgi:hypothetical protein